MMRRITKFFTSSIQKKIFSSFAIVIVLIMVMVTAGSYQLTQVRISSQQIKPASLKMGYLQDFALAVSSLEVNLDRFFAIASGPVQDDVRQDLEHMTAAIDFLMNNTDTETRTKLIELEQVDKSLGTDVLILLGRESNNLTSRQINEKIISVFSQIDRAKQLHRELSAETINQLQVTAFSQESLASGVITQFLILGTLASLIVVIASLVVTRNIATPLAGLARMATQITNGDFYVQAPVINRVDEVGQLSTAFNSMTAQLREMISSLEQRVDSRTQRLEMVATLSGRLIAILKLEELLAEVVNQVKERFGYYHAHIYLLNTQQEKLVVAAGTGEAGKVMLAQQHSVAKGRGIVGRAAEKNVSILVSNVTRTIGAEIVTKDNVAEIYQRETDPGSQTRWYRDYIQQYFSDFEGKSILKADLKLGYILHFRGTFTQILQKGAEDAARDLGISVEVVAPTDNTSASEAIGLFSQMIQAGKDGIVVVPQFDKDWQPLFSQAGIPVVTANRTGPNLASWLWFGQDSYQSGFVLARELVKQLQAQGCYLGRIVVGADTPTAYDMMARYAGFRDGLQNTSFTITESYETTYDPAIGYQIWKDLVEIHPEMIAAVGLSAGDIPNLAQLKSESGAKWLIAGYDLDITTLEAIKTGLVQVAIGQHPYLQGYLPILALVEHLRYGRPLAEWQMENWLPNSLLPLTKAELAVPISLEGKVVGVLDVQSDKVAGLDEGDANLLRSLANQVAVGIRNARQFAQVETALAEAHAAQQRYLEQSWEKAKIVPRRGQYHYVRSDAPPLNREDALITPVAIQNTPIGTVQLSPNNPNQAWTEDDLAIVEAVSEELAQVAENIRLFEETRGRAAREAAIRNITDKLRTAPSIEQLVSTATQELGKHLSVSYAELELGLKEQTVAKAGHGSNGKGGHNAG